MLDASELPEVRLLHPELKSKQERLFAAHMLARETALAKVFGAAGPPEEVLSPGLELETVWTGGGVVCFAPAGARTAYAWVTHGLSQPFPDELHQLKPAGDDEALSGFGLEYVLTTQKKDDWAAKVLLSMARRVLLDEKAPLFLPGHRVAAGAFKELVPQSTLGAMVGALGDYETDLRLPGGGCTLVHLVGVTADELEKAKSLGPTARGTGVLLEVLKKLGLGLVTDPLRACVTKQPGFAQAWAEAERAVPA